MLAIGLGISLNQLRDTNESRGPFCLYFDRTPRIARRLVYPTSDTDTGDCLYRSPEARVATTASKLCEIHKGH